MKKFYLEILARDKILISENVRSVTLPGTDGRFEVRAAHTALLTELRKGQVHIKKSDTEPSLTLHVSSGFVEVTPTKTTVFVVPVNESRKP